MDKKISAAATLSPFGTDFVKRVWDESWTYIKTVVDIVHEPILILDEELRVRSANDSFYKTFQVEAKDTEGKVIYELGNKQWDIPALRKLLEDILPKNTFFKGFEVMHEFPHIGRKVMILNARRIYFKEGEGPDLFPPIIMLAIEDITEVMAVAESFAGHANQLEAKLIERTEKLQSRIESLEGEITTLKKNA